MSESARGEPVFSFDGTTKPSPSTHTQGYAVMLQARRSRPHSQHRQHRQKQREVLPCSRRPCAGLLLSALVLFTALSPTAASSSGGRALVGHGPCFLGLSFGEKAAPAVPGPSSLGDRVRDFGDRVRREGFAGVIAGTGSDSADGGTSAMAAAQVRGEAQQPAKDKSNGRNSFIAGGLAGSVSTTITCPIEVKLCKLRIDAFDSVWSSAVGKRKKMVTNTRVLCCLLYLALF